MNERTAQNQKPQTPKPTLQEIAPGAHDRKLRIMEAEVRGEKHLMAVEDDTLYQVGTLGPVADWKGYYVVNQGYTPEQVAALVEETQSKSYDYLKREVLNFLEALLQIKGAGNTSVGNVVANILKGAQRVEWDIVRRLAPEITPEMITLAGEERAKVERSATVAALAKRKAYLEVELADINNDIRQASVETARERLDCALLMCGDREAAIQRAIEAVQCPQEKPPFNSSTYRLR